MLKLQASDPRWGCVAKLRKRLDQNQPPRIRVRLAEHGWVEVLAFAAQHISHSSMNQLASVA